ncbi:FAD:protein FMN transferase [Dysgonomonas sp. Marseille-P4677]|uniref:FAD:protein FMN transferase n=1 Tax=Dysgonomonas sp. Marseille-P4677 TaxID=2364790 RepID=UPI001911632C|nr:FAD:protein FMN transferase [Dysgonomonas sp. Marseille-P4677]MBK5719983.1 FAD:protein FMN transferase [Dysgonomonas sp. Marseille-P4677]
MDLLYKAQTRFLFHAHIKIKISAFYSDDIFDELFAVLENIDKKYNSYQAGSYFDLINKHSGIFVDVDDETIRILDKVIELSNFFDGRYDITIMPLIRLWGFYKDVQRTIPASHEIERVKPLVNYQNIEIEQNKVRIAKNQEIITASFIKAYAVDRLVEKMIQMGISDAIINAGGSTIRAITNELHPTWSVIVRNSEDDEHLFSLDISNQCYSTSSQVKTFVDINGHRYGHILNPKTGFPSEVKQVGIISDDCMIGDILSTALFNETKEGFIKKMNLLSANYHVGGFMIDRDSEIVYTQGFLNP